MILEGQPLSIRVEAGAGTMTSEQAVTMGLITTELVINALKHAFPSGSTGAIVVRYASEAGAWRLSVSDDGVGMASVLSVRVPKSGLGTSIVEALTRQLGGRVVIAAALPGTTVSVTVPRAA
jgi:two-component system, sensor histidine kinase PdtaS